VCNDKTVRRFVEWEIKDGSYKPEVDMQKRISRLVYMIATKVARFQGQEMRWIMDLMTKLSDVSIEWKINDVRHQPEVDMQKLVYVIATQFQ